MIDGEACLSGSDVLCRASRVSRSPSAAERGEKNNTADVFAGTAPSSALPLPSAFIPDLVSYFSSLSPPFQVRLSVRVNPRSVARAELMETSCRSPRFSQKPPHNFAEARFHHRGRSPEISRPMCLKSARLQRRRQRKWPRDFSLRVEINSSERKQPKETLG